MEMATVTLSFEKRLKEKAEQYFESLGITLEEYLLGCVTDNIIDLVPNTETLAAMAECEEMLKNPKKYPSYHSMEELMAALESDDE